MFWGILLSFSSSTPWDVKGKKWRPLQFPPPIDKCHYSLARSPPSNWIYFRCWISIVRSAPIYISSSPSVRRIPWNGPNCYSENVKIRGKRASATVSGTDDEWQARQARFKGDAVTIGYMVHRFEVIPVVRSIFGSSRLTDLLVKLPKIRLIR